LTVTTVNDRREISGWMLYDWANSAFQTTVVTVLVGPYLTTLAQSAVSENGVVIDLGPFGAVTAKSLYPFSISLSVVLQVLLLPLLGTIADYTHLKKRLMAVFCYTGATATCLLFFVTGHRYLLGAALLVVANLSFGAALVLYNAFLNEIATPDRRDALSSRGFALGYLGGGILLGLNLLLILNAEALGLGRGTAVRLSLLSAGVWWGGFAALSFVRLKTRRPARRRADEDAQPILLIGIREIALTLRHLWRLPQTLRFLLSYMAYNDGIQTVITVSSVVLAQELFVARGQPVSEPFLIGLVLMIQIVGVGGALLFERIAGRIRAKNAILVSLVLWVGVVVYAYGFLRTTTQAWAMGALIAIVLGGSQALSRSLFSLMIPAGREASFFGLYEISERGTSWMGPFIFGLVAGMTNSYRQAILSVVALFLVGMIGLLLTDTDEARREAGASS
jgi:UMF1 family MFS transporter